jgi:Flp pilus assembly protein TadG
MERQSGQSLFEVALMLPLLLLLALGVIELGRFAYIGILVGNAAHAGAFYGAHVNSALNAAGIQQAAANDFASNGQPAAALTVTSHAECGCDSAGTISSAPGYTLQTACSVGDGHRELLLDL